MTNANKKTKCKTFGTGDIVILSKFRPFDTTEECGAGVFMAAHFDRHYCGRCGLTYVYEK